MTGLLAESLGATGADVTLLATLHSITTAHLDGVRPREYANDPLTEGRTVESMHVETGR
jgi:hypothetical protein